MPAGSGRPRVRFAEKLRTGSGELWDQLFAHPFVAGLGDGSLSIQRFRYFMRQDYVFLVEYSRVLAVAVSKSRDLESMGRFSKLLDETLNSEMALHRGFCADFGISERQLERTHPDQVTSAYTDFLLAAAHGGGVEEVAAVLLPCQWSYDEIGRKLARLKRPPAATFHDRWIEGYGSAEYRAVTAWLIGFVDSLGRSASADVRSRMQAMFDESCRHELRFWDNAWNEGR